MPQVSAIVPAAGRSSRMGSANKLLLPYGNSTVIGTVVQTLRSCGLSVVVVTGNDAEAVGRAAECDSAVQVVFNPDWEQGLGTSIACGVRAVEADGYLIALADMPGIEPTIARWLSDLCAFDRIIVPIYAAESDRFGHPVLFGSLFASELCSLAGDSGARSIIERHERCVKKIFVQGELLDVDSRDEYFKALASRDYP